MPDSPPPQIDFITFALSLGSSAFVHLGDAPNPESRVFEPNLVLAKQTIDVLGMLEEKTKGNLTPEEASFLENLLADLRMRYVQKKGT
jgi:hypothetical protein